MKRARPARGDLAFVAQIDHGLGGVRDPVARPTGRRGGVGQVRRLGVRVEHVDVEALEPGVEVRPDLAVEPGGRSEEGGLTAVDTVRRAEVPSVIVRERDSCRDLQATNRLAARRRGRLGVEHPIGDAGDALGVPVLRNDIDHAHIGVRAIQHGSRTADDLNLFDRRQWKGPQERMNHSARRALLDWTAVDQDQDVVVGAQRGVASHGERSLEVFLSAHEEDAGRAIEDLDERPTAIGLDITLGEDVHDCRRIQQGF